MFSQSNHALYTRFLPRPVRKESNVPKLKSLTVLIYTVPVFNTLQFLVPNIGNIGAAGMVES